MPIPPEVIKALRYLIVIRVNASLIRLTKNITIEMLYTLGSLIIENCSTRLAIPWKKHLDLYTKNKSNLENINTLWPVEASLIFFPSKCTFNEGNLIFFEIKLFGKDANHDFFLEMILPAIENGGIKKDRPWCKPNALWGNYDVDSIFVADGYHWKPLAEEGIINLKYNPSPWQWFAYNSEQCEEDIKRNKYYSIFWINGFNIADEITIETIESGFHRSLYFVINSVVERLQALLEVSNRSMLSIWDFLNKDQAAIFLNTIEASKKIEHGLHDLELTNKNMPGRWTGQQYFTNRIPEVFIPYLNISSILHIGHHINLGAGTFKLIQREN